MSMIETSADFGGWFSMGHDQGIFGDSKKAVDARPLQPLDEINQAFERERYLPDFDLEQFWKTRFQLPEYFEQNFVEQPGNDIVAHIEGLWEKLTMKPSEDEHTRIGLRFNHIVPGERYSDAYYWDGYFTMLGLVAVGRIDQATNMLKNYTDMINRFGFVPNGTRSYYLSRSQPPFYSQMVRLMSEVYRSTDQDPLSIDPLIEHLPEMVKEWHFWNKGSTILEADKSKRASQQVVRMSEGSLLNRYKDTHYSPRPESYREDVETGRKGALLGRAPEEVYNGMRSGAATGWDYSSRWLADYETLESIHTAEIVPVDLNCILYMQESTIAEAYEKKALLPAIDDHVRDECFRQAQLFRDRAAHRANAINEHCWDEKEGVYRDVDFMAEGGPKQTPINSLAMIFALYAGIAPPERAQRIIDRLDTEFLKQGGLIATDHDAEHQWNKLGWSPLHRIAITAAEKYGFHGFARKVRNRFLGANLLLFENRGCLFEKIDVENIAPGHNGAEYECIRDIAWTAAEVAMSILEVQRLHLEQYGTPMPKELLRGAVLLAA